MLLGVSIGIDLGTEREQGSACFLLELIFCPAFISYRTFLWGQQLCLTKAGFPLRRQSWVLFSCVFIQMESQAVPESGCPAEPWLSGRTLAVRPGYPLAIGLHGGLGLGLGSQGSCHSLCIVACGPCFVCLLGFVP